MTDRIGQQLGHYRLIRKLGSGGFADVYQAEHIHLNTLAAVKLLNANLAMSDRDFQNFRDEARTIALLDHPHIVGVLDFGIDENIPYLVMDYAPNGTLRQRHPKGTRVPLPLVVTYVQQIASALHYAHLHRLIHRDVKPENLLLGRDNELLLGDFGAALLTHTSAMLTAQNIIGTISYMAPEQLQGKPSAASDQYALGIVVYEWLCGYCPFRGSLVELHNLQLFATPPSLRASLPTLSPYVEQVVMKALAKQPEQRFNTIQAFARALEQASQQVQTPPPPLFLPGNGGAQGQLTLVATQAVPAPSPSPYFPTMVASPATPLPETIMARASRPPQAQPHVHQTRYSRRGFLSTLVAATAVVSGGTLAYWMIQQNDKQAHAGQPGSSHVSTPAPTATPVPTKSDALYTYTGHREQVFTAAWSLDDKYIASAGGTIGTNPRLSLSGVRVWAARTGQEVNVYQGHTALIRMVAWSPIGTRIASASEDHTVQVWDAMTGNNPLTYRGHRNQVRAVAWSPNGEQIASASIDGTVQVWDATSGQTQSTWQELDQKGFTSIAWSPDGKRIASACKSGMVYIWDATSGNFGNLLHSFSQSFEVGGLAWSSDSSSLAIGDFNTENNVEIWNGSAIRTLPPSYQTNNLVNSVAWSFNSDYVAAGYDKDQVRIWNSMSGAQLLIYTGHHGPVISAQWSHSGSYIASCGFDETVQIWTAP